MTERMNSEFTQHVYPSESALLDASFKIDFYAKEFRTTKPFDGQHRRDAKRHPRKVLTRKDLPFFPPDALFEPQHDA